MGYDKSPCKVKLYDGTVEDAVVYVRNNVERGPQIDKPPTERYLEIIKEGCIQKGVKQEYIDFLNNHPMQKRKTMSEFRKLTVPPNLPRKTL